MTLGNQSSNSLIRWSCRSIIEHFPFSYIGNIFLLILSPSFLFYWEDFLFYLLAFPFLYWKVSLFVSGTLVFFKNAVNLSAFLISKFVSSDEEGRESPPVS